MIKTIKISRYQTGKARGGQDQIAQVADPHQADARKPRPLVGKKHPQGASPAARASQEIVGELIADGTLVAHIGQGWRETCRPRHTGGGKISIASYQYAIGSEAKAPGSGRKAGESRSISGRQGDCQGKPLPEKKRKSSKRLTRFSSQGPALL